MFPPDRRQGIAVIHTSSTRVPNEVLGATVTVTAETPQLTVAIEGLTVLETAAGLPEITVWATPDRAVVSHIEIGDFDVTAGRSVVIHPRPDANVERIRAVLHGAVATLILAQQQRFALHASTVEIGGRRVAISGRSGAGKSTTAVRLMQRGAEPVVDDVTVLDVSDGVASTGSWGRDIHIWPHVADELQVDVADAVMMGGPRRKWALPSPTAADGPVQDVIVLRPAPVDEPVIDVLPPLMTQRLLGRSVHYQRVLRQVWPEELFAWQVDLSRAVRVALLRRPAEAPTIDQVCGLIERWVTDSGTVDQP